MTALFRAGFLLLLLTCCASLTQAQLLTGTIRDAVTNDPLIGASVVIKGTTIGTTTDLNGKFSLNPNRKPPFTVVVSYIGYKSSDQPVTTLDKPVTFKLQQDNVLLQSVEVVDSRISDKQKESALTVEAMDIIAIKETPAANFYEGLGQLKGVDLTSASIGFKIINTRGFNSTSPVRSLQLIDGVDNQAPGLNFSLGNFLGAPDLDVLKVDLIVGASSAFYGPNAFNGVINMTTKNPFIHQGLSVSAKIGERNMFETAMRYAQAYKNKAGRDIFAYKVNFFYLRADDWEATNMNPTEQSVGRRSDPGGYDAVNRYGDERMFELESPVQFPALYRFYRTGYEEQDLVDYDTRNLKISTALHYKPRKDIEAIYAFNFGNGTTVYQGDNRYSLKDILFFQNRLELRKEDKWFVRAYATHEDAGNSYDAVFTALLLQNAVKDDVTWYDNYINHWRNVIVPELRNDYPDFPNPANYTDINLYRNDVRAFYDRYPDLMQQVYGRTRGAADLRSVGATINPTYDRFMPGTDRFDSAFAAITSRTSYTEGGSRFYDKSALYHLQGEYTFDTTAVGIFKVGGNGRIYTPNSNGTIFSDTNGVVITNREFGLYGGWEERFMDDKLKANVSLRADKNQNFNLLVSPAASLVYNYRPEHIFRISLSAAIRNPTLADQYLYYNVGTARLLGNLEGFDSLVTVESFRSYLSSKNKDSLSYFNVDAIRPEKVQTLEIGYRGTPWEKIYIDASYYFSFYRDFIGYNLGVTFDDASASGLAASNIQAFRIAANATDMVTTQGFTIGVNYYFHRKYALVTNYSWNRLNLKGSDDPIIPAFNTPEHKYNISVNGRDLILRLGNITIPNLAFNVNYKWIQGFIFEGSPQFTGFVPSYDMVDAQVNYRQPEWKTTFKLGCSNLLNNKVFQVYGGPLVGRLAYFSVVVDLGSE
jgi:outer membrane receptor protein involved in Fe transport